MADLNVEVWDATGNKRTPATLPDDAPVSKIIYVLAERLSLPTIGPDGMPLSYKFHHKNSGRQLGDSETLSGAGVQKNDILRMQPEITAGTQDHWATSMIPAEAVLIDDEVIGSVAEYLAADTSRERGGFLVGCLPSLHSRVTKIDAAIPCPDAPSTAYSLTFRGEEWQLVHGHAAVRDGVGHIVGWFHSHPGISIRMSERDLFIQRHFFADRGQMAWIRDPIGGDEAFWVLRDGNPITLPRARDPQSNAGGRSD